MKRADLVTQIQKLAAKRDKDCHLHREGRRHEVWKVNGTSITIPRHREVNDYTAKAILKQAAEALD